MKFKLTTLTTSSELKRMYDECALTFEGVIIRNEEEAEQMLNIINSDICEFQEDAEIEVNIIKGKTMNDEYGLRGNDRYSDDLTIVCIPIDVFTNIGKLAIKRFMYQGRWFNDVVDNNAAHN